MKNEEIMLSIYIPTYNHEKYIKRALDSVFSQKTKYKYEVLVGEDCSTDNTKQILKEYEREHSEYVKSGVLHILYRKDNMHQKKPDNADDLKARCKGKYIIALEGDDYWIDDNKIKAQIDFLESNPQYIAVAHNCLVVDENGNANGELYPECKEKEYTWLHFMHNILPGQFTTVMYRNIYVNKNINLSLISKGLTPGDRLIYAVLLSNGKIYCMQKIMSAYRHVTTQGTSFSATNKYNFKEKNLWYRELLSYLKTVDLKRQRYGEILYMRCLLKGVKAKQCSYKELLKNIEIIDHKLYSFIKWVIYKIRKDILHQKKWV